ncbi:MAG: 4-phosphoerythronate dehydrogenase, partial [Lentisphaerae bacterium]|nr:4-phosphoerythronate dehydrogenase [Lentisphaerota bacterium]
MKIVCSSTMPYAREAFEGLGEVTVLDGRSISARDVRDADILATRSVTKIDSELLDGSAVKFVGTATIGTDHMDLDYLEKSGIRWCCSPGCNANSVSEYVSSALLCLATRHGFPLEGKTIGVVGVGNVGSLVVKKAEALGMRVLMSDPPRQRAEGGRRRADDSLPDEALAKS